MYADKKREIQYMINIYNNELIKRGFGSDLYEPSKF